MSRRRLVHLFGHEAMAKGANGRHVVLAHWSQFVRYCAAGPLAAVLGIGLKRLTEADQSVMYEARTPFDVGGSISRGRAARRSEKRTTRSEKSSTSLTEAHAGRAVQGRLMSLPVFTPTSVDPAGDAS